MHHEIETAKGFIRLIDAVNEVEHFQAEVDDEGVEQVAGDGVHATHINCLFAVPGGEHIEQQDHGNARHHRGEEKHHRHHRGGPPGIRLDRPEDESDIAMQEKRGGNPHHGDDVADALVDAERIFADVRRAEREHAVEEPFKPLVRCERRTMSRR